jgi:hypothetical protein
LRRQPEHSTVIQVGFVAAAAASSSDALNASMFSAAAADSDGLTFAGSAFVIAVVAVAGSTSASGPPAALTP